MQRPDSDASVGPLAFHLTNWWDRPVVGGGPVIDTDFGFDALCARAAEEGHAIDIAETETDHFTDLLYDDKGDVLPHVAQDGDYDDLLNYGVAPVAAPVDADVQLTVSDAVDGALPTSDFMRSIGALVPPPVDYVTEIPPTVSPYAGGPLVDDEHTGYDVEADDEGSDSDHPSDESDDDASEVCESDSDYPDEDPSDDSDDDDDEPSETPEPRRSQRLRYIEMRRRRHNVNIRSIGISKRKHF